MPDICLDKFGHASIVGNVAGISILLTGLFVMYAVYVRHVGKVGGTNRSRLSGLLNEGADLS